MYTGSQTILEIYSTKRFVSFHNFCPKKRKIWIMFNFSFQAFVM